MDIQNSFMDIKKSLMDIHKSLIKSLLALHTFEVRKIVLVISWSLLGPHMKMWAVPYSNHSAQFCVDAVVAKVFKLPYPTWVWGLPMSYRCTWAWNLGAVTFDTGAMTLTLGILRTLLCPKYWCQHCQFVFVDYPWGVVCKSMEFWSWELWPWNHDLDLGILVDAACPL